MFNETNREGMMEKGMEVELKELAASNFSAWNQALLSCDPKRVASLYANDASFLPTLNSELKAGQTGAEEYFHHFLEKKPEGRIVEEVAQETSIDSAGHVSGYLHSGMYNFEVGEPSNRRNVEARFTFLWQKDEAGGWKIRHHHSSLRPAKE